jgi:hypothetical protein
VNLRPYQQQLVTEIRGQYQLGRKAVLAVLPTGGGKTVCFAHIAQAASVKGNRVLILVHRAELLDQASRAMPVPHGIIAANRAMDLSHTVQVAISANRSPEAASAATGLFPVAGGGRGASHHRRHMGQGHRPLPCRQAARRNRYANTR